MNLVYIFSGNYDGFPNVLKSARARSGSPITIVSNPASEYPIWNQVLGLREYRGHPGTAAAVARWLVLREMVRDRRITLPVFCSDWDIVLFSNLAEACLPFFHYDFAISIDTVNGNKFRSAAYYVNSLEALDRFHDIVIGHNRKMHPSYVGENDMALWTEVASTGTFRVGNMFEIINDSVFDHNIVCGGDRFKIVKGVGIKLIEWKDGCPYFTTLDNKSVKAHSIHCWGPFKTETGALIRLAGIV